MRLDLNTYNSPSARLSTFSLSEDANELSEWRKGGRKLLIRRIDFVLHQRNPFVSEKF